MYIGLVIFVEWCRIDVFMSITVVGNYTQVLLGGVAPLAPEIIPPVTRVVTYSKSSKPLRSKSGPMQSPTSDTGSRSSVAGADATRGWAGGEFTPTNRLPTPEQSSARTKRYSSQRLRNIGVDSGPTDSTQIAADGTPLTSLGTATQLVNATSVVHMPSRPVPTSAFYGTYCSSSHLVFSVVTLVMLYWYSVILIGYM